MDVKITSSKALLFNDDDQNLHSSEIEMELTICWANSIKWLQLKHITQNKMNRVPGGWFYKKQVRERGGEKWEKTEKLICVVIITH